MTKSNEHNQQPSQGRYNLSIKQNDSYDSWSRNWVINFLFIKTYISTNGLPWKTNMHNWYQDILFAVIHIWIIFKYESKKLCTSTFEGQHHMYTIPYLLWFLKIFIADFLFGVGSGGLDRLSVKQQSVKKHSNEFIEWVSGFWMVDWEGWGRWP